MAEYTDVIKHFKRMCKSITPAKCVYGECPIGREFGCENIGQCRKIALEGYVEFDKLVMAWAAAHPEPVYPAWRDWLRSQYPMMEPYTMTGILELPIPADIAEKLGIKPEVRDVT